jgi:hypothetical protein
MFGVRKQGSDWRNCKSAKQDSSCRLGCHSERDDEWAIQKSPFQSFTSLLKAIKAEK